MINIYNILIIIVALIYITILYTSTGLLLGYLINKYILNYINKDNKHKYTEKNKHEKINYLKKYFKLILSICIVAILCYLSIYILESIPSPFSKNGFDIPAILTDYHRDLIFLIMVGICPNIIDNMLLLIY